MSSSVPQEVTQLLNEWSEGNKAALDLLTPLVYQELHRLARYYMSRERPDHTLQTTALVNEAYIRLVDQENVRWQNRAHFFAVSAHVMRHILVDHARGHGREKRGGAAQRVPLEEGATMSFERAGDVLALDEALSELARFDPLKSELVELRYFGGLTIEETAEVLKIPTIRVKREWDKAKAWLFKALTSDE
jgi:RNA polymerase sigma factor (TIGR02999 family)